jgi:hypothetical protein
VRHSYFHLRAGDELLRDDQGQDFPDVSTARREAERSAREIVAEAIRSGREQVPEAFVIADELGVPIDTLPLAAVLPKPFRT